MEFTDRKIYLMLVFAITLLLTAKIGIATESSDEHFKMLSTIEYSGKGQFKSQVETLMTVRKELLSDQKFRYFISASDFALGGDGESANEITFVIDRKTSVLSEAGKDLGLFQKVNNACVKSLTKTSRENIGKTWKQSFKLPFFGKSFAEELKLTLTAIELKSEDLGDMIAVRALSEPFVVTAAGDSGKEGDVKARINAVYLFDDDIEDIYMSISVFEAATKINDFGEKLRYEIATYKTNAAGESVVVGRLSKKFEGLVKKVGLVKKGLKISKEASLPKWAKAEGLGTGQIAGICAATACEGALNPVAVVLVPAVKTISMQSLGVITSATVGTVATTGTMASVSGALSASVPAVGAMNLAAAPTILGVGATTAGAVAGGTTAVAAGGSSSGGGSRSQ